MEIFALLLAIPVLLATNIGYVLLVRWLLPRYPKVRPWMLWPSYFVLALAVLDFAFVGTNGAVAARTWVGPVFGPLQATVVLFGVPAVANVMLRSSRAVWLRRWGYTVAVCWAFGFALLLFNLGLSEALHGIDESGGPFSK